MSVKNNNHQTLAFSKPRPFRDLMTGLIHSTIRRGVDIRCFLNDSPGVDTQLTLFIEK